MIRLFKWNISLSLIQCFFWLLVGALGFASYLQDEPPLKAAIFTIAKTLATVILIYGNILWLVPRFYQSGSKATYFFLVLVLLLLISLFRTFILYLFHAQNLSSNFLIGYFIDVLLTSMVTVCFSFVFRLAFDFFTVQKEKELLKQYSAEIELNLLKAQVQPHFLFNTLNNIYYVAQKDSPETADLIEKLSNIMRYFVDEGPRKEIFLITEINFIRDYIDLEKMRMRHPLKLDIQIEGDINKVQVSPMLIIPLIENVFKHGVNKRYNNNELLLHITRLPNSLSVIVQNRIFRNGVPQKSGSGLHNLRARLQLLYNDRYELETAEKRAYFIAQLNIPLQT